jgi:RNA polymerase sigma-B factor
LAETVNEPLKPERSERRARLIESHLALVIGIARRYQGRGESLDDLVQVGSVGLIRACDRFDPTRGVAFATFAKPAIEGEIRRYLEERAGSVHIPREVHRLRGEVQRARERLEAALGRAPTAVELARASGLEKEQVERVLHAERASARSETSPDEVIESQAQPASLSEAEDRLLLAASARVLEERERRIVFLRFHADMTEEEIARELGISQTHVSRLLRAALVKLHAELAGSNGTGTGRRDQRSEVRNGRGRSKRGRRKSAPAGPKPNGTYSGRFLVRIPSSLHERLSLVAKRNGVSLNRFVTEALAASVMEIESSGVGEAESSVVADTESPDVSDAESPAGANDESPLVLPVVPDCAANLGHRAWYSGSRHSNN